jgi:hypothetical protein
MLWMIAMLLMLLWLFGVMSRYMMGGFIHLLLLVALVMALVHIIQGRRTA